MVHVVCALVAFLLAIQPLQGCGGGEPGNCPEGKVYKSEEACYEDHVCSRHPLAQGSCGCYLEGREEPGSCPGGAAATETCYRMRCKQCVINVRENITTTSTVWEDGSERQITETAETVKGHARYYVDADYCKDFDVDDDVGVV